MYILQKYDHHTQKYDHHTQKYARTSLSDHREHTINLQCTCSCLDLFHFFDMCTELHMIFSAIASRQQYCTCGLITLLM